ncbi:MAG: Gfo/Idh/MocA family oxidoreductase [Ramlibacter sp.]|nr:Gfo/Idh/MocA family oxidoreductase [Ramlibacter sp.]
MRVLVTGRGSIARRHVRHLRDLCPGATVGVLASQAPDAALQPCEWIASWSDALAWRPQAIIVASVSARHAHELLAALQQGWPCLAEKPLVVSRAELEAVEAARRSPGPAIPVVVGCNLRYMPSLHQVKAVLQTGTMGRIVRAHLEVGQDLAQWRPGRVMADSYSAQAGQGGGVLFDLVHEVDMARHLLGELQVRSAVGGHFSRLPLEADDVHVALLRLATGAPVTISMDYVSRRLVRRYVVVGEEGTLYWDLPARKAWIDGSQQQTLLTDDPADFDMAATYRSQMQDWLRAIADPAHRVLSPLDEALETTSLMLAMKEAAG